MIVEEYKLGNTTIRIDNTYFPKTEEEKEKIYEAFNDTALEILRKVNWWKGMKQMTKEQKIYYKVGQAVCKTIGFLFITGIFTAIGIGFFM